MRLVRCSSGGEDAEDVVSNGERFDSDMSGGGGSVRSTVELKAPLAVCSWAGGGDQVAQHDESVLL